MSLKKTTIAALMAASGLAVSSASFAQANKVEGFYIGGSYGQTEAQGSCPAGFSCDLKDTGWKVFGGYRLNRNFAVEGFYGNWGEITVGVGAASAKVESTTFGVAALGILPLGEQFELFGKLGLGSTDIEATGSGPGGSATASDSGSDVLFGVGAAFNFTRNFAIRAEWERLNDSEIDILSIGLQYRF
jgi:OOP family OmpA-OmpF porin